jgi:serine/threonine protein kinase
MKRDSLGWVGNQIADGRYRIDSKLGEGGMGYVYRAHDSHLETDVVIKVPRRALMEDAESVERFMRENRSLVQLAHPHVVRIIDVGQHEGLPFAVMQFLSGGSLEDRRPRGEEGRPCPMPPETLRAWLADVAKALDFVHSQGYVHRDVKPANILFDQHENVYLSDFGVIKALAVEPRSDGRSLTGTGMVLGTPDYMAPEVILGQPFDGRADQYALAVMAFDLLAGGPPFQSSSPSAVLVQHSTTPPPRLDALIPSLPPALTRAVLRGMEKSPERRFGCCAEFAEAILDGVEQVNNPYNFLAVPASPTAANPRVESGTGLLARLIASLVRRSVSSPNSPAPTSSAGDPPNTMAPLAPPPPLPGVAVKPGDTGTATVPDVQTATEVQVGSTAAVAVPAPRRRFRRVFTLLVVLAAIGGGLAVTLVARRSQTESAAMSRGAPVSVAGLVSRIADWNRVADELQTECQPRCTEILQSMSYSSSFMLQSSLQRAEEKHKIGLKVTLKALQRGATKLREEVDALLSGEAEIAELTGFSRIAASTSRKTDLQHLLTDCEAKLRKSETRLKLLTQDVDRLRYHNDDTEDESRALDELEKAGHRLSLEGTNEKTLKHAARFFRSGNPHLQRLALPAMVLSADPRAIAQASDEAQRPECPRLRKAELCYLLVSSGKAEAITCAMNLYRAQGDLLAALESIDFPRLAEAAPETWKPVIDLLVERATEPDTKLNLLRLGCRLRQPGVLTKITAATDANASPEFAIAVVEILLECQWIAACQTARGIVKSHPSLPIDRLKPLLLEDCLTVSSPMAADLAEILVVRGDPLQARWALKVYCQQPDEVFTREQMEAALRTAPTDRLMLAFNYFLETESRKGLYLALQVLCNTKDFKGFDPHQIRLENVGPKSRGTPKMYQQLAAVLIESGQAGWVVEQEFGPAFRKAVETVQQGHARNVAFVSMFRESFEGMHASSGENSRLPLTESHFNLSNALPFPDQGAYEQHQVRIRQCLDTLAPTFDPGKQLRPSQTALVEGLDRYVRLVDEETQACAPAMKVTSECFLAPDGVIARRKVEPGGELIVYGKNVRIRERSLQQLDELGKAIGDLESRLVILRHAKANPRRKSTAHE